MLMILRTVLVLLPFFTFGGKTGKFKDPEFIGMTNFSIAEVGLRETRVKADLLFYNPNDYKLQLKKAALDFFVEEKHAGNSDLDTFIRIPAKDSFLIPVEMKIDMKNAFPNALLMLQKEDLAIRVAGFARVGRAGFFVNIPVNYSGLQPLPWKKRKPPVVSGGDSLKIVSN